MARSDPHQEQRIAFLRELNRSRDLETLSRVVLQHAVSLVPSAQRGSFMLLNRESDCYEFGASVGWPMEKLRQVTVPRSQMLQQIAYGNQPAIIREPYEQDYLHGLEHLGETFHGRFGPDRAILSYPVHYLSEVIAYLNLDNIEDPDAFGEEDLKLLEPVIEDVAVAVHAVLSHERLTELERFFRLLFEQLADAVYITELDGTVIAANRAATEQSGYRHAEIVGLNVIEHLSADTTAFPFSGMEKKLRAGEIIRFEETKIRKDGTTYLTDCAVSMMTYLGRPVTLSVNRDVTDQRESKLALERRNRELMALFDASKALTTTLDLDELITLIQEHATSLIPCDSFFIALRDKRNKSLTLEVLMDRGRALGKHTVPADPEKSLTAWVAAEGEPLRIGDTHTDPIPTAFQQVGDLTRSWLGVPLMAKAETVGVMSVQSLTPHAYSEEDERLLTAFASLAASAVRKAGLHRGLTNLQMKLLAVEEAARQMKLAETKVQLYTRLQKATAEIFQPCVGDVWEADGAMLNLLGLDAECSTVHGGAPLDGPGIAVAAWHAGEPLYTPDVTEDTHHSTGHGQTKSALAIPFSVDGRKVGVFDVHSSVKDGILPEDRNLLEILTAHMAVSLSGLERLEGGKLHAEKLQRLHQAVQEMQRCATTAELCETAVHTGSEVLGLSLCLVAFAKGDSLVAVASSRELDKPDVPLARGEGVAGTTWATGQTMWGKISDFTFTKPLGPDFANVVAVPLGDEGVFQAIGTVQEPFTAMDVSLAEILAGHLHGELKRIRLQEALREQATRDPLTGLYNRRFLSEVLEREMERGRRYGHPMSVVVADIDQFKRINDRFGHLKGDHVLQEVAVLLQHSVRECDYVFRYGGEEFILLLPETGGVVTKIVERLEQAVEQCGQTADLEDLPLGITMGFTVWDPKTDPESTSESLLRQADAMLYTFKRSKKRAHP